MKDSTYASYLSNLLCLSDTFKDNMDCPFTIDELENTIRNIKLNKASGPDSYTNEFYKKIIHELKHWLMRAYFESYRAVALSGHRTIGTVTCIPKAGKVRNTWKKLESNLPICLCALCQDPFSCYSRK